MAQASLITGLILAGGQGARMGGADKGLQLLAGEPLVRHVLRRLQPQADSVMISANRNLDAYGSLGVPVWTDIMDGYAGPLAGLQAGLTHCATPLLACVPCDAPFFPADLVAQLHAALENAGADIAVACAGAGENRRAHPVFCLLKTALLPHLSAFILDGGRKVSAWQAAHKLVEVFFGDENAFRNINNLDDLQRCEAMST